MVAEIHMKKSAGGCLDTNFPHWNKDTTNPPKKDAKGEKLISERPILLSKETKHYLQRLLPLHCTKATRMDYWM